MASAKELREARARVRELTKAIASGEAAEKAAAKRAEAPATRRARLEKAQAKVLFLTEAAAQETRHVTLEVGKPRLVALGDITSAGWGEPKGKAADIAKSISSGETKVQLRHSSIPYTLGGMLNRSRMVTPADIARIRKAEAALNRAIRVAKDRAADLVKVQAAIFEASPKVDKATVGLALAARFAVRVNVEYTADEVAIRQRADVAERQMTTARAHLRWLEQDEATWRADELNYVYSNETNGGRGGRVPPDAKPAECPCGQCVHDRGEAAKRAERDARIASLPTAMRACAIDGHGRHRVSLDTTRIRIDKWSTEFRAKVVEREPEIDSLIPSAPRPYYEGDIKDVPAYWCQRDRKAEPRLVIDVHDWYARLVKAAKEQARAERAAAKRAKKPAKPEPITVTPTVAGDPSTLDFICPSCHEREPFEVEEGDDGPFVYCSSCGYEGDPDVVKTVAKAA